MVTFDLSVDQSNSTENNKNAEKEGIDYIEFNGERYDEFIEVNGENIPKIEERFTEGEQYAFSTMVSYVLGPEIGESELSSAVRKENMNSFPNRAIGQTEDSEELDLENAISPGHYWYRKVGAKGIKENLKEEFHEKCEKLGIPKNLLVYKKNFPRRTDTEGESEMAIVEENENSPWESIQVPQEWMEKYGGMPPVLKEKPEPEPEESEIAKVEVPDEIWEDCNTDAAKMRTILEHNPEFEALEKRKKVEFFMEECGFGEKNAYDTLRDWNPESKSESEIDSLGITKEELEELREKARKYDEMMKMVN